MTTPASELPEEAGKALSAEASHSLVCPLGICDGSGEIRYVETEPENTRRPIGNGLEAGPATIHGTRLCECRERLAPREGKARWWTTESVFSGTWESEAHQHTAEVSVDAEVPVSDDGYKLLRTGNRYYPTMVDLDLSQDWLHALFAEEARSLAALLVAAADKCDEIDGPCVAECGHWSPCDCKNEPTPEPNF